MYKITIVLVVVALLGSNTLAEDKKHDLGVTMDVT